MLSFLPYNTARSIVFSLVIVSSLLIATEVSAKINTQAERYPQIITGDYLEQIGRQKIEETLIERGEIRRFEIDLNRVIQDVRVPIGALTYKVILGRGIHYGGLTPAAVQIFVGGKLFRAVNCYFNVHVYDTILVATHDLKLETPVVASDFALEEKEIFNASEQFMLDPEPILGKVPVRVIRSGSPVSERLFQNPIVIEVGSPVQIVATFNGVSVRTEGVAMQRGRVGGFIKVKNVLSSKILRVKVIDEHTVEVA